ncbi:potassium-transporting ATPase subunit C [Aliifodinibius salipaludis]|uniref:Potassium-transporting ATPase KdpC subunit n=1 Tax=Fodinibius salipaludis TaxID=2032627 RepID=A0A2A2GDA7_9BACT|nr:potassium-transporting ATPase subunit C [Aliifodinibius salipaludis]PAU94893.1 potassium-transporting ATPase subunit C [Aliifodinibius salipaludis]
MKNELLKSFLLSVVLLGLFAFGYPFLIKGVAMLGTSHNGEGEVIKVNDQVVGYELIGQRFTSDRYFNSRPGGYDAAGTGGSNKGPMDPDYLETVQTRIDSILAQNPDITKEDIPTDMVTASGSDLDRHFSPQAAYMQIPRISKVRDISEDRLRELVNNHVEGPLLGFLGPNERVHVLRLNIALDELDNQ